MRKLLLGLILVLLSITTTAAREIMRAGAWRVDKVITNDTNVPMCVMTTTWADRAIFIKWVAGGPRLYLHMTKNTWRIPEDAEILVELKFDRDPAVNGTATTAINENGNSIILYINPDYHDKFLQQVIDADKLLIRFPDGNERTWTTNLTGTERVTPVFMRCIQEIEAANTQPHQGARTQPNRRGPTTTQPHQKGQPKSQPRRARDDEL